MFKFSSFLNARTVAAVVAVAGLSACSATEVVTPSSSKQSFALAASTPRVATTDFQQLREEREAERKKKLKAETAKRKAAEKKRQLAAAKDKKEREAKRLAAFDKMTAALNDQQKQLLKPQRDSILNSKKAAEKQIASLTPRPVYRGSAKGGSTRINALIAQHARANGVPLSLARAVVRVESSFRPNARGAAGEIGLMQIKLATARLMGYKGSAKALYHPENNIKYGMKYLGKAHRLAKGSTCGTILKYNAGHGAKRMNPISARYCKRVRRYI